MLCKEDKKNKIKLHCYNINICCNFCSELSNCGTICDIKFMQENPYEYKKKFNCTFLKKANEALK